MFWFESIKKEKTGQKKAQMATKFSWFIFLLFHISPFEVFNLVSNAMHYTHIYIYILSLQSSLAFSQWKIFIQILSTSSSTLVVVLCYNIPLSHFIECPNFEGSRSGIAMLSTTLLHKNKQPMLIYPPFSWSIHFCTLPVVDLTTVEKVPPSNPYTNTMTGSVLVHTLGEGWRIGTRRQPERRCMDM